MSRDGLANGSAMKWLRLAAGLILACATASWAAGPASLTTVRAIRALSNAQASQSLPVAFEATVTYSRVSEGTLFVQDGDAAIYVSANRDAELTPGDRVLVVGKTQAAFSADVVSDHVTLLHHGVLPKPVPATFDELIQTQRDCMLVTIHAVVRSADLHQRTDMRNPSLPMHTIARVQLLMDGGYIEAFIDSGDIKALSALLDAEVEITGTAGKSFDGKMQPTGGQIYVSSLANVKILKRAATDPWSLPIRPMNLALSGYHVRDLTQRIRVHGTITYYQPGSAVVIQDGAQSLWITTQTRNTLHLGDRADAIGFPEAHNGMLALTRAEIQDSLIPAPIQPLSVTWKQLTASGNLFDLVSIEGQVVTAVREATQDEYVLAVDGQLFTAIYRHSYDLPPMKQIPQGSKVRVTGICVVEDSNPFDGAVPFNILLRSFDDITVVANPSPLNIRNLLLVVGLLLVIVFAALARGWALEHKMRHQTAAMSARTEAEAELERQRSRILEDINGSKPLTGILEQIARMVSSSLHNVPCWCQIADGAKLGDCPREPHRLRIVQAEIDGRSGPVLGVLFAGLDAQTPPSNRETVALHNGARLAALAIETRRLYTELRRRSEFDLLTDVPNRFAMEKFMETRIEEARQVGGTLGLIYIDLDKFKPINDTYGHHVGDLYLQAVAARMSRQLLGGDMLARLGGDEFAALATLQHGGSDLDRIVARLELCFAEPFLIEGHSLHGAASLGIALYPQDGVTKDSLLSAADAAMYAIKKSKRRNEKTPA